MISIEEQYLNLLQELAETPQVRADRTRTGTFSKFGAVLEANYVEDIFPLLTTKSVHFKSVVVELLWFLRGDTNTQYLRDNGVTIWDEWATEDGSLGPIYGAQWRRWYGYNNHPYDQIKMLINGIKENPTSRRHIVSAWNVPFIPSEKLSPQENVDWANMALAPCHMMFQVYIRNNKYLDLQVYQRSADIFLGVPFNLASYALLMKMLGQVTGYEAGTLRWLGGDVHLYSNHVEQAVVQLERIPRALPHVELNPEITDIDDFKIEDIELLYYNPYPRIKAPIAI